jgi:hypothetical protein
VSPVRRPGGGHQPSAREPDNGYQSPLAGHLVPLQLRTPAAGRKIAECIAAELEASFEEVCRQAGAPLLVASTAHAACAAGCSAGATAFTQAAIAVIAVLAGWGLPWSPPVEILALNAGFVALFLGAAWLFQRGAHG